MEAPHTAGSDTQEIALDRIVVDESLSPRLGFSKAEVQRLTQIAREGGPAAFAPVVLAGPRADGAYVILDGRYRVAAAQGAGWTAIAALPHPGGSRRELFAEAVRLAARHSRPLTKKEKRRAIYQLLRDFPETELSTRQLADLAGVRHNLVAVCRRELQNGGAGDDPARPPHPPAYFARRALREFRRLTVAAGPAAVAVCGAALAEAARAEYADADPAAELAALAAVIASARESARRAAVSAAAVAAGGPAAPSAAGTVQSGAAAALTPVKLQFNYSPGL